INIPAGEFTEGYGISKYPVTNAQYGIFCSMTGHNLPGHWDSPKFGKSRPNNPVVGVSWHDANSFVKWLGMRLPTEAEWEHAASGPMNLTYPWGNEWDALRVNFNTGGTSPVNAHPEGVSGYGVEDMSGNVWEWVNGEEKNLCGGAWYGKDQTRLQAGYRYYDVPGMQGNSIGFRPAADAL
ncbi:MAG: formylglycine-generating enzyme family protein, partial [Candidatus Margulisiibacteriota bacterium]